MNFQMRNPFLRLLKNQVAGEKSELFNPPTAYLDLFMDGITLNVDMIIKHGMLMLGMAGSGKSNGVGKTLEEILKLKLQMFLFDVTGEHEGVVEMYAAQFDRVDFSTDGITLAKIFIDSGRSLYLDCSKTSRGAYLQFLNQFLDEVFAIKKKQSKPERKPTIFVIEECHNLIPERINSSDKYSEFIPKVKETLRTFNTEGRKYGCPCLLISLRPAMLDKAAIGQVRLGVFLKVMLPADVKTYGGFIPGISPRGLRMALFKMVVGQAFVVADGKVNLRRFKKKKSPDLGETPGYAEAKGWKEGLGVAEEAQ